jgi:hypothetical protein
MFDKKCYDKSNENLSDKSSHKYPCKKCQS